MTLNKGSFPNRLDVITPSYNTGAETQEVERSSANRKISSLIPGSSNTHVDVSLGKIDEQVGTLCGSSCHQCMNVCECDM